MENLQETAATGREPLSEDTIAEMRGTDDALGARSAIGESAPIQTGISEVEQQTFEAEHPDTDLATSSSLARSPTDRARVNELVAMQMKILERERQIHGGKPPNTAEMMDSVSRTKLDEALTETLEKLGDEHPEATRAIAAMRTFNASFAGARDKLEWTEAISVVEKAQQVVFAAQSLKIGRASNTTAALRASPESDEAAEAGAPKAWRQMSDSLDEATATLDNATLRWQQTRDNLDGTTTALNGDGILESQRTPKKLGETIEAAEESRETVRNDVDHLSIKEALLRFHVPDGIAQMLSLNELRHWKIEEIHAVMKKIRRSPPDHCPLARVDGDVKQPGLRSLASAYFRGPDWVCPPLDLIRQAAMQGLALCVNAECQFTLRNDSYMALSHVWDEGLKADESGRGLARRQLRRVFQLTKSTGALWLWIDALAIPNAKDLSKEEKTLKIMCINMMGRIYGLADAVVVIDALLLHLYTDSAVDVAVALLCGRWITRVWTYQEALMAKEMHVITADPDASFIISDILFKLDLLHSLEDTTADTATGSKYEDLAKILRKLYMFPGRKGISLADIATTCTNREATNPEDYAIGFCGILRIKMQEEETRRDLMAKILNSQKYWACELACLFGSRLMKIPPRWAPSNLCNLTGTIGVDNASWEEHGLKAIWAVLPLRAVTYSSYNRRKSLTYGSSYYNATYYEVDLGEHDGKQVRCQCLFSKEDSEEEHKRIEEFKEETRHGKTVMLLQKPFSEHPNFARGTAAAAMLGKRIARTEKEAVGVDMIVEPWFTVEIPSISYRDIRMDRLTVLLPHGTAAS